MIRTLLLILLLTLSTSVSANEPTLPWINAPSSPQLGDTDWQDFAGMAWGQTRFKHPHPNYDWCHSSPGGVLVCEVKECPLIQAPEVTEPVWAAPVQANCKLTFVFYHKRLAVGIIEFLDEYQGPDAKVNGNLDLMYWNGFLTGIYGTPAQHFETNADSVVYGWATDWRVVKEPGQVGDWVCLQQTYNRSEGYNPLTQIFFVGYQPVYPQALVPYLPR